MRGAPMGILAAGLAVAGCGGGLSATVPRPTDLGDGRSVTDVVPEDTTALVWVDLASLRRAELYGVVKDDLGAWARALERMDEEGAGDDAPDDEADFFEAMGAAQWLVIAAADAAADDAAADDAVGTVTLVGGQLTDAQARALVRLEAEAAWEPPEDLPFVGGGGGLGAMGGMLGGGDAGGEEPEPPAVQVLARPEGRRRRFVAQGSAITELRAGVWALGPAERVAAVVARASHGGGPRRPLRTAALGEAIGTFDHDVTMTVVDLDRVRRGAALLEGLEEEGADEGTAAEPSVLDELEGAALRLDVGDGVEATALLEAPDERAAGSLAREVRRAIAELVEEDVLGVFGLPRLLARIETEVDGSHVTLALSLDSAEAHLWWGRISGAVGAALFVVELLSGLFRGFGDALEGTEGPAAPAPQGGTLEGSVVSATTGAPVAQGASCTARVLPGEQRGLGWMCHAELACDGKTLYGGPESGWFACSIGGGDDWFVAGDDGETSSVDGDAAFHVDTIDRRIDLADDADGAFGDYRLEIRIGAVLPEPGT